MVSATTSNRDRAVEIMRKFWKDGRYAVGFDEIADALVAAGVIATETGTPSTMAEIEWSDAEHQGLEAVYRAGTRWEEVVRMLSPSERNDDDVILCMEESGRVFVPYTRDLTPLHGTKVDLTPTSHIEDETTPESSTPRTVFSADYIYIDSDGDEWECLDGRWITGDNHYERVAEGEVTPGRDNPPEEYGPYRKDRLANPEEYW